MPDKNMGSVNPIRRKRQAGDQSPETILQLYCGHCRKPLGHKFSGLQDKITCPHCKKSLYLSKDGDVTN
jgi:hypothetical protein